MKTVRLGIVGAGNISAIHLKNAAEIEKIDISAICDINRDVAEKTASKYAAQAFTDYRSMLSSGQCDAVLIATPHYQHCEIGIAALEAGIHTLVEKPIAVHKADCERLIAAHKDKSIVFAAMFNQRTDPRYKKIKRIIESGQLGAMIRINWIVTDWFRTHAYYSSGSWRATWHGEGGGVLLNQCPHQLDLLQWLGGMPEKVCAFCRFGAKHDIEVEDEVTAYLEYANGATGVFITSTGEAPGTNRLEICGEMGKIVVENESVRFRRNEIGSLEFSRTTAEGFAKPDIWDIDIPVQGTGGQHREILENFADAILEGKELIAPAEEGIHSVELANAMLYSSLKGCAAELPLDGAEFEKELDGLIKNSKFYKE
jgi:predicted dehydrogenase